MQHQMKLFDGFHVESQKGRMSVFEIEEADIHHYGADNVLVLVTAASVTGAAFKTNRQGDWVRTNILTVHQVYVAEGEVEEFLVEKFNMRAGELALDFDSQTSSTQPEESTDRRDAEDGIPREDDEDDEDDEDEGEDLAIGGDTWSRAIEEVGSVDHVSGENATVPVRNDPTLTDFLNGS